MAKRTCSIEGCERPSHARSWCTMHYGRWFSNGDPNIKLQRRAMRLHNGYMLVYRPDHPLADERGFVPEHRMVAYDAGLLTDLADHVHHRDEDKRNNALENLEVLTGSEHARRHAAEPSSLITRKRAITHCPQDHEYTPENTYVDTRGRRSCIECRRTRDRGRPNRRSVACD